MAALDRYIRKPFEWIRHIVTKIGPLNNPESGKNNRNAQLQTFLESLKNLYGTHMSQG